MCIPGASFTTCRQPGRTETLLSQASATVQTTSGRHESSGFRVSFQEGMLQLRGSSYAIPTLDRPIKSLMQSVTGRLSTSEFLSLILSQHPPPHSPITFLGGLAWTHALRRDHGNLCIQ